MSLKNLNCIEINVSLTINRLKNLINKILFTLDSNGLVGYNKELNTYWYKKFHNKKCVFYIEIKIMEIMENKHSILHFTPIIGDKILIHDFISTIYETIQLYKTSAFTKMCLQLK
jgi:hypothetical protein